MRRGATLSCDGVLAAFFEFQTASTWTIIVATHGPGSFGGRDRSGRPATQPLDIRYVLRLVRLNSDDDLPTVRLANRHDLRGTCFGLNMHHRRVFLCSQFCHSLFPFFCQLHFLGRRSCEPYRANCWPLSTRVNYIRLGTKMMSCVCISTSSDLPCWILSTSNTRFVPPLVILTPFG